MRYRDGGGDCKRRVHWLQLGTQAGTADYRHHNRMCCMRNPEDLLSRAQMFSERAERVIDPISRQHYIEMAAHYRTLAVEHQQVRDRAAAD